jgi:copper chaperone NosL
MTGCRTVLLSVLAVLACALAGCDAQPKAIVYGRDECAECRMILADRHYGAELITPKGKILMFDDVNCLLTARARPGPAAESRVVLVDFNRPNVFLPAAEAWFLQHDRLRTPMASGLAVFATEAELETARQQLGGGGRTLRWAEVLRLP